MIELELKLTLKLPKRTNGRCVITGRTLSETMVLPNCADMYALSQFNEFSSMKITSLIKHDKIIHRPVVGTLKILFTILVFNNWGSV